MAINDSTPINQTRLVTTSYFDSDTGKKIDDARVQGIVGQVALCDFKDRLANYQQQGYELVTNGLPDKVRYRSYDQVYAVILKHHLLEIDPQAKNKVDSSVVTKLGIDKQQYQRNCVKTVYFVTTDGAPVAQANQQRSTWLRKLTVDQVTGKIKNPDQSWTSDRQTYNDVAAPVVKGYYADQQNIKGEEAVNWDINQRVIYRPVGKIIPMGPNGRPLTTGVPYINDPADPTKVQANERVPKIAGYKADRQRVTPASAGADTVVKYQRDIRKAVIRYLDTTTNTTLVTDKVSGDVDGVISYVPAKRIQYYHDRGYQLVENGFPNGAKYRADAGQHQEFTVKLAHATKLVSADMPQKGGEPINAVDQKSPTWPGRENYDRDFTFTVSFINLYGQRLRKDQVQSSHWTRTIKVDLVTGKIVNPQVQWYSPVKHYHDVTVPVVRGYYTSKKLLHEPQAIPFDMSYTIVYHALGRIIPTDTEGQPFPHVAHPQYANDPVDPTAILIDKQIPVIPGYSTKTLTINPSKLSADTKIVYYDHQAKPAKSTTPTKDQLVKKPAPQQQASTHVDAKPTSVTKAQVQQPTSSRQQTSPTQHSAKHAMQPTTAQPSSAGSDSNTKKNDHQGTAKITFTSSAPEPTAAAKKDLKDEKSQPTGGFFSRLRSHFKKEEQ